MKMQNVIMMRAQGQKLKIIVIITFLASTLQMFGQTTVTSSKNYSVTYGQGKSVFKHSSNGIWDDFELETRGDIEVTDDDRDIKSISSGGYFELSKTTFGNRRTVVIRESDGTLIREFYEGRKEIPYEPSGRQWLADVLPEVLRSTGVAAKSRVKRFYKEGGVEAVMNELEKLRSDHVKTIYANELLDLNGLNDNDYEEIVRGLSQEISSDHYLSQILTKNAEVFLKSESSAQAFFDGIGELSSDHYASLVLREAITDQDLNAEMLAELLKATEEINSDHYITTVLTEVLKQDRLDERVLTQLIKATEEMGSDHYKSIVLTKALREEDLSREAYINLMNSVTEMSSDHYITEVLRELLERNQGEIDDETLDDVILFTQEMSSDHYIHIILGELVSDYDLSDQGFESLMEAVTDMSSDHYASVILLKALDESDLSGKALINIIKSTSEMSSDHYKVRVLEKVAERIDYDDKEVKEVFQEAVKNISSDQYYGRLMRILDN